MSSAFFFSENYLKAETAISQNVDYQDIKPFIEAAQETILKPYLGKFLYDRLSESITDEDYNADELELIKLCRPVAAYQTCYMAMPFLQTKIRNKGLVMGADQYIQTVSRADMEALRASFLEMAGFYMRKLDEWFCLNWSKFPEYTDGDPLNKKTQYTDFNFGGWMPTKAPAYSSDKELILKMINWRKY